MYVVRDFNVVIFLSTNDVHVRSLAKIKQKNLFNREHMREKVNLFNVESELLAGGSYSS